MVKMPVSRVRSGWRAVLAGFTVVALTALLVVGSYRLGYLNETICDGPCGAAYIEPPDSLEALSPASRARTNSVETPLRGAKVQQAVEAALGDNALGKRVGFSAIDLATGKELWSTGEGPLIPASTNKLFTTFAALWSFDPRHRFSTSVQLGRDNHLVLHGGGDPYLSSKPSKSGDYPKVASIDVLAKKTHRALKAAGLKSVTLGYDASLFSGPAASPEWESLYISENIVTPISALWVDQGGKDGVRASNPPLAAAQAFAAALAKKGITVTGSIRAEVVDVTAETVVTVKGPTVGQIVELVNQRSDNEAAEVLFRQLALKAGLQGSFDGGTEAVKQTLRAAGIDVSRTKIHDGSGLSRHDRTTAATLAETLYAATQHDRTKALLASLPIAGFSGSLRDRFSTERTDIGLGTVRAKTGTLSGVHGLAGVAVDVSGRGIIFAAVGNGAPKSQWYAGRTAIDRVVAAMSSCDCG